VPGLLSAGVKDGAAVCFQPWAAHRRRSSLELGRLQAGSGAVGGPGAVHVRASAACPRPDCFAPVVVGRAGHSDVAVSPAQRQLRVSSASSAGGAALHEPAVLALLVSRSRFVVVT